MKKEYSAGGAIYKKFEIRPACRRGRNSKFEILWLICKHSGYHKWVLPKGIIEKGETKEQAAVREVEEECGIKAVILREINHPETYQYELHGEKIDKTVYYFLMKYDSGDIKNHNWEMEDVRWVTFDEALKLLAYQGAKRVLEEANKLLHLSIR